MKRLNQLIFLCLFGMISIAANAEVVGGSCGDNAKWSLDTATGLLSITGSGKMTDYIPNNVPWYNYRNNIISLSIGSQITSIGDYAFIYCSGLTNVPIPNSVTSIGRSAFCDCSSLTEIEIPNSVSSIGDYAFASCSGLTSVVIPNSVILIGEGLFQNCSNLTSPVYNNTIFFKLPKSYSGPFNIPNGITTVASEAFYGCSSLTSVTIPNSVTSIGNAAFERCSNLITIVFPNSVTSIGSSAFYKCSGLTSVEINIVDWSNKNVAATISDLSDKPFSYIYNGREIGGDYMIPEDVKNIGGYALYKCNVITKLTIPKSVTSIGEYAFYRCSGLTSVTIPNSVTSIGGSAFSDCSGLKSITVNWSRPLSISDKVFNGIDYDNCILYVPKGTSMMYMSAPVWINFKYIEEFTPDDEDIYTITIRGAQGTIVKQVVELSKSYKFVLDNDKEGNIVSVEFNGKDVTSDVKDGIYTTPIITGNSEIMVTYDNQPKGDTNNDGVVDVADITEVAKIILTGKAKEEDELLEEDVD